jgi:SNF2 family DNA or RNA helicase
MYAIHAELSADGTHIVMVAAGANEAIAHAAKLLETLTPLFRPTDPKGGMAVALSWPALVQLAATFGAFWQPGPRLTAWVAAQIQGRTAHLDGVLRYLVPAGLVARDYQRRGAQMVGRVGSVLITDEPRTGKTITTILGLREHEVMQGRAATWPAVCVVPPGTVDQWVEAWRLWSPDVPVVAWRGSPAARLRLLGTASVYVVGYSTAARDAPPGISRTGRKKHAPLLALEPKSVVIDECHWLKNRHALRSLAVRRMCQWANCVVALSGTPITHHPGDLWATLAAMEPSAYPSGERYDKRYLLSMSADYDQEVLGLNPHTEPEFRRCLLGAMRRVARADPGVLEQMPPKVYSIRTVELPPVYRTAYDSMESDMIAELIGEDGEVSELNAMSVLAQLTRLSQLASAAADVTVTEEMGKDGLWHKHQHVTLKMPSWKVDALLDVLEERPGDHTLCFTPSKQLAMLAGEQAAKAGYRVGYIVGGQSAAERTQNREDFQAGKFDLLSATTGSGGTGLTLTRAGTLVFLQRPWSIVESLQAEDRAEGIGASLERGTEIIDIVARNTIDTRVRSVLRQRAGQLSNLLQDPRIVAELLGGTLTDVRREQKVRELIPTQIG